METFEQKAVQAMNEFDPTEIFFQKMYRTCFRFVVKPFVLIDPTIQKNLENCFLRYYRSYRVVCEEAHINDEDFVAEDELEDFDEDDEDGFI